MAQCGRCGEENAAHARFCQACGTALVDPQGEDAQEERKIVSVLFCDLVGFTALSDNADPEDVRALLRPYFVAVRSALERQGGTVEKFIGDAVMAVFGAPVAHEDDAARAVRAALSILTAVAELRTPSGHQLAVRIGVATGEALVSLGARPLSGEGLVAGDVVNTAARLQAAAPTGTCVVGEATYWLTRAAFRYAELEPASAKGKAERLPVWQVLGGVSPSARRSSSDGFFVGRERESALLARVVRRVVQERSPQFVTIIGEPGVGKSRLVSELRKAVEATSGAMTWRYGRCLPMGDGITFWALGEIIKEQADILDTDDLDSTRMKLAQTVEEAVQEPSERGWIAATLAPLVGLTTGERGAAQEETFAGWRRFLEALAARQPLVLVVEDLHWADAALLAFLSHLRDASTNVPMLLLGTSRPELLTRTPEWVSRTGNSLPVPLPRLAETETAELLSKLLGATVLDAATHALLLQRCGGNPLYAEEFVRLLHDPRVAGDPRASTEAERRSLLPLPESLHALIAARVDTLALRDKAILYDAAVIGPAFWSAALAAVGDSDEVGIRLRLENLISREFLTSVEPARFAGHREYAFTHELIRHVAYGQIPRLARAAKHRATAGWLEAAAGERVADHAEILAHHYGQALQLSTAARDGDAIELRRALRRFTVLAADRAVHLDPTVADGHFRRALDLLPAQHPERPAILNRATVAALAAGRTEGAAEAFEEARKASLEHGDRRTAAGSLLELASVLRDRGDTVSARNAADAGYLLLQDDGTSFELARALWFFAFDAWLSGRPEEALSWAGQLLEIAEVLGRNEIRGLALMERGRARLDLDDPRGVEDVVRAVSATQAAVEEGSSTAQGSWQLLNWHANLVEARWLADGTDAALSAAQEAERIARQRGLLHPLRAVRADGLKVLLDAGRWDELLTVYSDVTASQSQDPQADYWQVVADICRAQVLLHRGELSAVSAVMMHVLPQATSIGDLQVLGPALEVMSSLRLAQREDEEAVSSVVAFLDKAQAVPSRRALHLPAQVRVCTAVGALALAERLMDGTDLRLRRHASAHSTARATLAESQGAIVGALKLFEDAAAQWSVYGDPWEQAQALFGAGRCATRLGRPHAVRALSDAREVFLKLGARPAVRELDGWLGRR